MRGKCKATRGLRGYTRREEPTIRDYDKLFARALEAGRSRDYRAAADLLSEVAAGSDRHPQALLYLGRAYHSLGELPRALQVLESYLRTAPDSVPGRFFLARTCLALGRNARAAGLLAEVVAAQPGFAPAESLLGLSLLRLHRTTAALAHLERAVELAPDNERIANGYLGALVIKGIRACRRGGVAEAEPIFRFVLERRPDNLLAHVYLGRIYREAGQPRLALQHYDRACALAPDDPVLPMLAALAALRAGRPEMAGLQRLSAVIGDEAAIGRAVTENPDALPRVAALGFFKNRRFREALRAGKLALRADYHDAEMHSLVAGSYLSLGEPGRARNHFERALQHGAARLETSYGLALALWELGEHEELLRVASRIEHLNPGDRTGRYFRALARSATEKAGSRLVDDLRQAIHESGPDANLMTALGRAYLDTGLQDLAVGWLERTLKVEPGHGEALALLVQAREALGQAEELGTAYRRYLDRFPGDSRVRRRFADHLSSRRLWDEAARELLLLLPRRRDSRPLREALANCYLMAGRYRDAAVLYRELLRERPGSLVLLRALVRSLDRMRSHRVAISLLEKADPYFKGHPEVLLPLGVQYIKVKDYERAQATLRRLLASAPRDWRVHHNLARAYEKAGQPVFAQRFFENARRYRAGER